MGVRVESAAQKLLHHLRLGVTSGRLICPISASMFIELMKQSYSPSRRIGTAQLIDELSLGVSIMPSQMVMGTEIHSFLLRAKEGVELHPMQELVWTKAAYALGDIYPSLMQLPPKQEISIQKDFFDYLWDFPLIDIVTKIGDSVFVSDEFAKLSEDTNKKNAQYRGELRSFAQTYDIELRGAIALAAEVAADVIQHLAESELQRPLSPTSEERAFSVNIWCNCSIRPSKNQKRRMPFEHCI